MFWARAADRAHEPAQIVRVTSLFATTLCVGLGLADSPAALMFLWSALGMVGLGIIPIVDGITMELTQPNRSNRTYGRVRVWGSVGYIVIGQLLGLWLTERGDNAADPLVIWSIAAAFGIFCAISFTLKQGTPRQPAALRLHTLFSIPSYAALLLVASLHWMSNGVYHVFFGAYVRERGGNSQQIALALLVGVVAEITVFSKANSLQRMLSVPVALGIVFVGSALRWALTALAPNLAVVMAVQAIHGLSFGLFWVTCVRALSHWVPNDLRSRGQGLFAAIVFGLANGIGSFVFGQAHRLTGHYGTMFWLAVGFELVAVVLLIWKRSALTTTA